MSRFFKSAAFPILIVVVLAFFAQKLISPGERHPTPNYSEFLTQFLTVGHLEWLARRNGGRYHYEQERIDRAVYLLWDRACHLYTSHIMSLADVDWQKPFFSDEGLY